MKHIFYKLWNYSPAQIVNIFRNKFHPPQITPAFALPAAELSRLQAWPRYTPTETNFLGKELALIDASSYLAMVDELFAKQNYKFVADKFDPRIIDCGSNIGLSVIFFKTLYPQAKVIAFEPDAGSFATLTQNLKRIGHTDVEAHEQAVWVADGQINFFREGSWGGKITAAAEGDNISRVATVRLKDYLSEKIDFLKIDIEGAETEVLIDCAAELKNVQRLFVEYHSSAGEPQTLATLLTVISQAGLRYYIKEASERRQPFIGKTLAGFDLQLDIFAYRDN